MESDSFILLLSGRPIPLSAIVRISSIFSPSTRVTDNSGESIF